MCMYAAWKDKILDYEIETVYQNHGQRQSRTWKDKILDYEIETILEYAYAYLRTFSWKDKILDYEIETKADAVPSNSNLSRLEKIRFSITRLKLGLLPRTSRCASTWKDKILDYEIETLV